MCVFLALLRERRLSKKGREEQKLALGTIKNTLSALRGCLNPAVEDGLLPANPPRASASCYGLTMRFGSADELSSVLAACRDWSTKRAKGRLAAVVLPVRSDARTNGPSSR